jgi:prepilin-type N-terminal cleavage/methylation domain-containing protein
MRLNSKTNCGMTLFEVLVVIAVVLVLAAIFLPALTRPPHRHGSYCANDLKQVGLAFKVWAGDNQDKYPMEISVTNGGTMELVDSGTVWQHFAVMSNELNTPRILFCPNDDDPAQREANQFAVTWDYAPPGPAVQFSGNSNTSYFVGVDATDLKPSMPLAGDRNITLSNLALRAGLHSLPTNAPTGWSDKMHVRQGNILLSDGSVQGISSGNCPATFTLRARRRIVWLCHEDSQSAKENGTDANRGARRFGFVGAARISAIAEWPRKQSASGTHRVHEQFEACRSGISRLVCRSRG